MCNSIKLLIPLLAILISLTFCNKKKSVVVESTLKKPATLEIDAPSFNRKTGEFIADKHTLALWHFDEGREEFFFDETKYEHDGVTSRPSWSSSGIIGTAFESFDDSKSDVDDERLFLSPEYAITIEGWFYIHRFQNKYFPTLIGKLTRSKGDGSPSYMLWLINSQHDKFPKHNLIFGITNHSTSQTEWLDSKVYWKNIAGKWQYIAATYNGEHMKVYINAELKASRQIEKGTKMKISNLPLHIGYVPLRINGGTDCVIDELRISDVARSAKAIKTYWDSASKVVKR